jgi:hypothetical protein
MSSFPQTRPIRAPRVKLGGSILALLRLDDGSMVRAKMHQLSINGGLLHLAQPLGESSRVEVIFHIGSSTVRNRAQMLGPMWATRGCLQPFRFHEFRDDERYELETNLQVLLARSGAPAPEGGRPPIEMPPPPLEELPQETELYAEPPALESTSAPFESAVSEEGETRAFVPDRGKSHTDLDEPVALIPHSADWISETHDHETPAAWGAPMSPETTEDSWPEPVEQLQAGAQNAPPVEESVAAAETYETAPAQVEEASYQPEQFFQEHAQAEVADSGLHYLDAQPADVEYVEVVEPVPAETYDVQSQDEEIAAEVLQPELVSAAQAPAFEAVATGEAGAEMAIHQQVEEEPPAAVEPVAISETTWHQPSYYPMAPSKVVVYFENPQDSLQFTLAASAVFSGDKGVDSVYDMVRQIRKANRITANDVMHPSPEA